MKHPRYLLLQVRNPGDAMRENEIACFANSLGCPTENIVTHDLISSCPTERLLDSSDAVLVGGSGDYSVVSGGEWLSPVMDMFRELYSSGKPTFASCWGFQAFAQGLGGEVVTDLNQAEIGTLEFELTEAGKNDPVFEPLGDRFHAQIGHQDIVVQLPPDAIRLCSTARVQNQAFTFPGKPIYGTQFHPEIEYSDFVRRLVAYPEYVENITGLPMDKFIESCFETPETTQLLKRFKDTVFG